MAVPDYKLCDVCGGKCRDSLFVETGYSYNGVENVTEGCDLDLCGSCAVQALKMFLGVPGTPRQKHAEGQLLLGWVKEQKAKVT